MSIQPARLAARDRAKNFARVARFLARSGESNGLPMALLQSEKQLGGIHPVTQFFRAAVSAGSLTSDPALAALRPMAAEFAGYVYPLSVAGRMDGLHNVPMNLRVGRQTSAAVASWVSEGGITPMSPLSYDGISLPVTKFCAIVPFTNELLRFMDLTNEDSVLSDMTNAAVSFMDSAFLDPTLTAVPGLNPASITSGGVAVACSGATGTAAREDLSALVRGVAAYVNARSPYFIMSKATQIALSFIETNDELFSHLTPAGGFIGAVPVLVSNANPAPGNSPDTGTISYVEASEVLMCNGPAELDVSSEATLVFDSLPDSPTTGATVTRSLWQENLSAIKLTKFAGWLARRPIVAGYISGVAYAP